MRIIADTNFLIYLAKYKIFDEIEQFGKKITLPLQVLDELKGFSLKKGKDKEAAALCLIVLKRWEKQKKVNFEKIEAESADAAIVKMALAEKEKGKEFVVATHDRRIIKKLKKAKIRLIGVRQKRYLAEK